MTSSGRSNLNTNGRGTSVNWFENGENIWEYEDWGRTTNNIQEKFDFSATTNSYAYDSTHTFELDKRGDKLGQIWIMLNRGAVTGSGTDLAFNDYEGYSTIDTVNFVYNNKTFYSVTGDILYTRMKKYQNRIRRNYEARAQYGEMGLPDRVVNATGTKTWVACLFVPWGHLKKRIPMVALPNKIEVQVKLKPLNQCCGGTPTSCTINWIRVRAQYLHLPQEVRNMLFDRVNGGAGIAIKIATFEQHKNVTVASTSTSYNLSLKNIKNDAFIIHALLRPATYATAATLDIWNFRAPSRMYLMDQSVAITNKIEFSDSTYNNFGSNQLSARMFPYGAPGLNIPSLPLCEDEMVSMSEDHCYGSRCIFKYNNPELRLEWDVALDADQNLVAFAEIHNTLLYVDGEVRTFLAQLV